MQNFIEKIKALNFPLHQYVVVGSGSLEVLGIRPAADIDISVVPELHKKLRESGEWKEEERYPGKIFLMKKGVDINPELSWSEYPTTTADAIKSAMIVEGIPFLNLQELKKFKKALGRDKDLKDIELIDNYLSKHGSV